MNTLIKPHCTHEPLLWINICYELIQSTMYAIIIDAYDMRKKKSINWLISAGIFITKWKKKTEAHRHRFHHIISGKGTFCLQMCHHMNFDEQKKNAIFLCIINDGGKKFIKKERQKPAWIWFPLSISSNLRIMKLDIFESGEATKGSETKIE